MGMGVTIIRGSLKIKLTSTTKMTKQQADKFELGFYELLESWNDDLMYLAGDCDIEIRELEAFTKKDLHFD